MPVQPVICRRRSCESESQSSDNKQYYPINYDYEPPPVKHKPFTNPFSKSILNGTFAPSPSSSKVDEAKLVAEYESAMRLLKSDNIRKSVEYISRTKTDNVSEVEVASTVNLENAASSQGDPTLQSRSHKSKLKISCIKSATVLHYEKSPVCLEHTVYTVYVHGLPKDVRWPVYKSFLEFLTFGKELMLHPSAASLLLPSKPCYSTNVNKSLLDEKQEEIQKLLDQILGITELARHPSLLHFLAPDESSVIQSTIDNCLTNVSLQNGLPSSVTLHRNIEHLEAITDCTTLRETLADQSKEMDRLMQEKQTMANLLSTWCSVATKHSDLKDSQLLLSTKTLLKAMHESDDETLSIKLGRGYQSVVQDHYRIAF